MKARFSQNLYVKESEGVSVPVRGISDERLIDPGNPSIVNVSVPVRGIGDERRSNWSLTQA